MSSKVTKMVGKPEPEKKEVDHGRCEHGVKPWWDCEECSKKSTYHFSGNFR